MYRSRTHIVLLGLLLVHGLNFSLCLDAENVQYSSNDDCDKKQGSEKCKCYKTLNHDDDRNCDDEDDDDDNDVTWWIALTVVLSITSVILVIALVLAWCGYCCCCHRYTKKAQQSSYEDTSTAVNQTAAAAAAAGTSRVTTSPTNVYTIGVPPPYSPNKSGEEWEPPHYKMDRIESNFDPTVRAPSAPPPPYEDNTSTVYINVID